jgi:hypothetical protein
MATSAFGSASFLLGLKLPGQGTSNLNGVGALLQPHDLIALQGPNMGEAGGELLPSSFSPAAIVPQGDDAVAGLEELSAHGDEALEVLEETAKKVANNVVEANINSAIRKAFNYFPPDVRGEHLPDDFGVAPRFVEPTDNRYLSRIRHESLLKFAPLLSMGR